MGGDFGSVLSLEGARALDTADPLARCRDRFYIRPGNIYLDGNSLGLASRDAEQSLLNLIESWKLYGIDGWTAGPTPWFYLAEHLGAMQTELMGAMPDELVVTGTTTVNQHALVATFYHPDGARTKILADALSFPSDIYALQSQIRLHGLDPVEHLRLVPSEDGRTLDESDIIEAMTEDVALVLLPSVLYRSGQLLDLARLAAAARTRSIPIGFDCSHSAGSLPHRLHDWGVDFAFWCSYKYLNGGPGAAGSLFVHERHFGATPGLTGWFGVVKERQFDMSLTFEPAHGAGAWQISTPTLFGAASLIGALRIMAEAGIEAIRAKSLAQTEYLLQLADAQLSRFGFQVGTPREANRRGGHIALEHPEAVRICKALKARGITVDYRPPGIIRLAPVALYTSYEEIWEATRILREIMEMEAFQGFDGDRGTVA